MGVIRRTAEHDPLNVFPELTLLDCMKDVKIVCKDGLIMWNSALLCQWSQVMRILMKEGDPAIVSNPAVIILPDVEASILDKLLKWSVEGQILLTSEETQKVTATLHCFGALVQFSQQLHFAKEGGSNAQRQTAVQKDKIKYSPPPKAPIDKEQKPPCTLDNSFETLKVHPMDKAHVSNVSLPTIRLVPISNEGRYNKRDGSVMRLKKKPRRHAGIGDWNCMLCASSGKHGSNALIIHLARCHFEKQLVELWGVDLNSSCTICGQAPFNHRQKKLSTLHKKLLICSHLAASHGRIYDVADEDVLMALQDYKQQRRATKKLPDAWDECANYFATLNKSCGRCVNSLDSPRSLAYHLATSHFSQELLDSVGAAQNKCLLCDGRVLPTFGNSNFNAVRHIVAYHADNLYKLLPKEGARLLKLCRLNPRHPPKRPRKKKVIKEEAADDKILGSQSYEDSGFAEDMDEYQPSISSNSHSMNNNVGEHFLAGSKKSYEETFNAQEALDYINGPYL